MKPPKSVSSAQNAAITGAGTPNCCSTRWNSGAVLGDALDAAVDAMLRHHAVGEFQEGLREDLLAAILVHHLLVVDHQVRGGRDRALRNALATASRLNASSHCSKLAPRWQAARCARAGVLKSKAVTAPTSILRSIIRSQPSWPSDMHECRLRAYVPAIPLIMARWCLPCRDHRDSTLRIGPAMTKGKKALNTARACSRRDDRR